MPDEGQVSDVAPQLTDEEVQVRTQTVSEPEPVTEPSEPAVEPTVEQRIQDVERKLKAAEREIDRHRQRAEYWQDNYQKDFAQRSQEQFAKPQGQPDEPNKPKAASFETYDQYLEALTDYNSSVRTGMATALERIDLVFSPQLHCFLLNSFFISFVLILQIRKVGSKILHFP